MSLTAKQARFVEEYLVDLNGTAAAIRAGYSKNRARQQAYIVFLKGLTYRRLLRLPRRLARSALRRIRTGS